MTDIQQPLSKEDLPQKETTMLKFDQEKFKSVLVQSPNQVIDYKPQGVCSKMIHIELENNIIKNVQFVGGCPGNTLGISHLIVGLDAHEAEERLQGITCGSKNTSCPDQLAQALKTAWK